MSALLVASIPLVAFLAVATKPDLLHSAFALGALLVLALPEKTAWAPSSRERALLVGLLLGGLVATKTSGITLAGSLLVAVALVPAWRRSLSWRDLALASLLCGLVAAPGYVKNLFVFGNPVFPAGAALFPAPDWTANTRAILYPSERVDSLEELLALWRLPWGLTFVVKNATMNNLPGPLLLLGAILLVLARPLPKPLRHAWGLVALTAPAWLGLFSMGPIASPTRPSL
jgi:hypothetical protein